MRGATLISTVELIQEAIHRVNKRLNLHIHRKSVIVLVIVYKASIESGGVSQKQICARMDKTHNQTSQVATMDILRRLRLLRLIEQRKEGKAHVCSCTVAGSNYIQLFERTLREVRQKF